MNNIPIKNESILFYNILVNKINNEKIFNKFDFSRIKCIYKELLNNVIHMKFN